MASNDNWLGFSLSPKQAHSPDSVSELGFNSVSEEQVSNECFHLTSRSPIPSLNTPFAIFEAFTRNPHSQDWNNIKDMSMNSFSCSTQQNQETPKLENFLGQNFTENNQEQNNLHGNGCVSSYTMYQESGGAMSHPQSTERIMNRNSNMGLSMIKSWLRNHPVPPLAAETPPPQTLSLSMSTGGSQSSDNKLQTAVDSQNSGGAVESLARKSADTFGQRTSIYRGVTRHRWTGRYEAHLWDNSCRREGQSRKGRQVYLGGYDKEDKAARSYDLAALKYWGTNTTTNFPISNYEKEVEEMKHMTRQEYVASLRRKSSGFSRGASIYRGVTRHHQHGRWQARIGRVAGNKDLYLGTFTTQEEAAEAYDIAAIKFRGLSAVTNFEINRYDVKSILESSSLPIGGSAAKRLKEAENAEMALQTSRANEGSPNHHTNDYGSSIHGWPAIAFQSQPMNTYPFAPQRMWFKQEQDSDSDGYKNQSFLQLPSVMHNHMMIGLDSSPVEQSSSRSCFAYANETNSSFVEEKAYGYDEGMFGLYYQSSHQQSPLSSSSKASLAYNDQVTSACNNWIPSVVPALAARVCNGAPPLAAWNDL